MKTIKTIAAFFAVSLFFVFGSPAIAQDLDKGLAALQRGDHAAALKEWRPLAEQGNALAQSALGLMYYEGRGVTRDYLEAVEWYRKAAEQGNAWAQNNLGVM